MFGLTPRELDRIATRERKAFWQRKQAEAREDALRDGTWFRQTYAERVGTW